MVCVSELKLDSLKVEMSAGWRLCFLIGGSDVEVLRKDLFLGLNYF